MTDKNIYPTERIVSIDRARGLLVMGMILCQIAGRFGCFGFFGRMGMHDTEGLLLFPEYALADLGEPVFLLLLALSFWPSYQKRTMRDGVKSATLHFLSRFTAVIGVGYLFRVADHVANSALTPLSILGLVVVACAALSGLLYLLGKAFRLRKLAGCGKLTVGLLSVMGCINVALGATTVLLFFNEEYTRFCRDWWGPLESIGCAGLLLLLFAGSKTLVRGIAAAVMLFYFSVFHQIPFISFLMDCDVQAGILGTVSWSAMLLGFSVMADLFYADRANKSRGVRGWGAHTYEIGLAILTVLGVAGALLLPVNKGSASPGYVLASMPMACLLFYLVSLTEKWQPKYPILSWWGQSPLLMYMLQFLFYETAFFFFEKIGSIPFAWALLYLIFVFVVLTCLCRAMQKHNHTVRL